MPARTRKSKTSANNLAKRMRGKGYNCSVYKKKKGWGVSVSRPGKNKKR